MGAYFVKQIEGTDDGTQPTYVERSGDMIEKQGGNFLVGTRKYRIVEGNSRPGLRIIIRFPTMEALSSWYDSAEYPRSGRTGSPTLVRTRPSWKATDRASVERRPLPVRAGDGTGAREAR